jgi:hypothetical protein
MIKLYALTEEVGENSIPDRLSVFKVELTEEQATDPPSIE